MLTTLLLRRRISTKFPRAGSRLYTSNNSSRGRDGQRNNGRRLKGRNSNAEKDSGGGSIRSGPPEEAKKPSLIEQLFPEETKRFEDAQRKASREVPRLPLDAPEPFHERQDGEPDVPKSIRARRAQQRMEEEMKRRGANTSILVLRNASTHLTEEDFRRLIPQGRHMEGWRLEQGDFLKVVPGRDLATLEQQNYYYLLFASQLSAFAYQSHATQTFRLAAQHMPSSITSPIPPPSGYYVDGMDADAAIKAFSLIPVSQKLELRQLRTPLSPMVESIVRDQGYSTVVGRKEKMPFEVRLTMDGPQLPLSAIRHHLRATGQDRALPWSGGDEIIPKLSKWEPSKRASPMDHHSRDARNFAQLRTEEEQMETDLSKLNRADVPDMTDAGGAEPEQKRRTPQVVYIVGFYTESAAQTFMRYWHRRPMDRTDGRVDHEGDLPPVANVEMLW